MGIELKPVGLKDENTRKGLGLGEVRLRRNKKERWKTEMVVCEENSRAGDLGDGDILSDEKN